MIVVDILGSPGNPTPSQLLTDMAAIGADGAIVYVLRRTYYNNPTDVGCWTPAHVAALRSAGKFCAPVVVPAGNSLTTPADCFKAAIDFGFDGRSGLYFDMEGPYNLPSYGWWNEAIAETHNEGWRAFKYGNSSDVASYPSADGWWWADYVQHSASPVQPIPPGKWAWQYANLVSINGRIYDVSNFPDSERNVYHMIVCIGTDLASDGVNHHVYHWTGTEWIAFPDPSTAQAGSAAAVAVLVNNDPNPWIVAADETPYRWNGSGWDKISGAVYIPAASAPVHHSHSYSGTTSVS